MAAITSHLSHLSQEQRRVVAARVTEFERNWTESGLAEQARALPAEEPARQALLIELVCIDLDQRWRRGQHPTLETYLIDHPDLGPAERVPVELVQAEHEVRQRQGDSRCLDDLRRRFPRQTEQLAMASTLAPVPPAGETAVSSPTRIVATPPAPVSAEVPEQLGRYRILKKLGQGGMGAVYLAHDTRLDRQVALKVQLAALGTHPEARERFFREARAASALRHPNLCPVHDADEINGIPFLTMAFIEGRSLSDLLQGRQGGEPLPQRQVAALVRKLARAMQVAHEAGVIHRDLKPANVLLTPEHEPVITDFGLARREGSEDARLSQPGQMMGTPAYMPPEQVLGDLAQIGPRSDVYSLGVILYELLTGRLPYTGSSGQVLAGVVGPEPPAPPSRHRPDLDPPLEAVCLKAMAKRFEDRFAGMAAFAEALEGYLAGFEGPTQRLALAPTASATPAGAKDESGLATQLVAQLLARLDGPPRQATSRWVWGAAAAAVMLLLAGVGYLVFRPAPAARVVAVQLGGIHITSTVVFVLNGQEVAPQTLQGAIDLPVGDNVLEVRRPGGELIEKRIFQVGAGDRGKEITLPPEKTDDRAAVRLEGLRVDDDEKELAFLLDDRPITHAELAQPRELQRGLHELAVLRDGEKIGSQTFAVGVSDDSKAIPLSLDYRRVTVRLTLPDGPDLKDSQLSAALDGEAIALEDLDKPRKLLPGEHELVLARGDDTTREKFRVGRDEDGKEKRLALKAPPASVAGGGKASVAVEAEGDYSEVVKALLPAAKDSKPAVRAETAAQLGVLKDRTAVPLLCKMLADEHHAVRKAAAESLDMLGDRRAVAALRKRVEDGRWYNPWTVGVEDPEAGGKAAALKALRALGPDQVTDALIVAVGSREPHLRRWAARELATQKDTDRALPALRKLVASAEWYRSSYEGFHDPDWGGRTDALALLRKLDSAQTTDALIEAVGSTTPYVRRWAAVELSAQKDNRKALPAVKKQVEADNWHATQVRDDHDPERGGKGDALNLFRKLAAKEEVTAALCKALRGSHKDMRRWAAEEIGVQKDPTAEAALKERVADEVWYEREFANIPPDPLGGGKAAALKALRELARLQATEPLMKALFSRSLNQRKWAGDELAIQNDRAAIAALKRRVADDVWGEPTFDNQEEGADKRAALKALKVIAPGAVKTTLTEALKSKEAKVRQWAVKRFAEENK